jgi:hypothetical protein
MTRNPFCIPSASNIVRRASFFFLKFTYLMRWHGYSQKWSTQRE